ncbi:MULTISPECIES: MSMEG_0565 family glycosyltransferase [Acetobacter]|uniref:Glycosyl transferase n=2 Tax=Acetobacter TaxID=434 RepID=A0AAN1PFW2_9PROT|nr:MULTISPECIES: MSMEG_0565 family glycosyltransferase [Acetobacter]ASL41177.1 glycosyl transferase [Acetobacter oryzifermentans]AXM99502.1 glycosyl transferase [Acetobacter pomorum]KAA8391062.1 MSMEG_0565 family glycosyltransferase [Acetobacter sp. DmW_125124]KAA8394646.1 MSMEG_0565 family glycosyltransferase [Acetobacter sp. DmW_125127]KAA8400297.1 MSMEG_0565 family glycosyltransferase [Acetobacter sp. DmW_125128]
MSLSIGILTHSTNPRGGVVHGMALAEALCDAGHDATLIAPDVTGTGFFRTPRCTTYCIPAVPETDLPTLVERRIGEISDALRGQHFDVLHAQDPISANALAELVEEGWIPGFARTVHHLDRFSHPGVAARQTRGLTAATELFTVSQLWEDTLLTDYGRHAPVVGNGVDLTRFFPEPGLRDQELRARYGLPRNARLVLSIGGIERRKNTLALLEAFEMLYREHLDLHLVIAGGASLLDHSDYRCLFEGRMRARGLAAAVTVTGTVVDEDMPAFYRQSSVLAYPSRTEGFGLCPLEALACGIPVVVPAVPPFTEHLHTLEAFWCQPEHPETLVCALRDALSVRSPARFQVSGPATARRFDWRCVASRHLPAYLRLAALPHAGVPASGVLSSCPK